MPSEQDSIYSSDEQEPKRRPNISYQDDDAHNKNIEDYYDAKPQAMRFYPPMGGPQHPIPGRGSVEQMMGRPTARPISPRHNPSEDSDLTDAMVFLNRIKDEYSDNLPIYDSFLETMRDFKFGKIDADEVCKAVRILFKEKPFLIRFFDEYLPHHLKFTESRSFDPSMERSKFPPFRSQAPPGYMGKMAMPMSRIVHPPNMHIPRQMHQMPPPPPAYMQRPGPPSSPPVELITKNRASSTSTVDEPKKEKAKDFIQLVKKKYSQKPAIYKQFVEFLQKPQSSFDKLLREVTILLSDTPELIEKFEKDFRPSNPTENAYASEIDPLKSIKDNLAEKGVLEDFLKIINFYNQNYISSNDLIFLIAPIINDQEQLKAFKAFIKYEDSPQEADENRRSIVEKIGSYVILASPFTINPSSSLSKEVLNNICYSVSTHESEDDTYVFRNKNSFEEMLTRVGDERSECDLVIDRLKYLISNLEELYSAIDVDHMELDAIQMSTALVKETLKKIYENKSNEILEALLENPRKAIPVVLKRLYMVYKDNLLRQRQHKKAWRAIVDHVYFKAYDTRGVAYKMNEKNLLSLKHIAHESAGTFTFNLSDLSILDFIQNLFSIFIRNNSGAVGKKVPVEKMEEYMKEIFEGLKSDSINLTVGFDKYAMYYYICILYERFQELKEIKFEPLVSNKMAVDINIQEEYNIQNRFDEVLRYSEELMSKKIDHDYFEEKVRQLTDSKGYKLYNLKKIMSKIERQVVSLIDNVTEPVEESNVSGNQYLIRSDNHTLTMSLLNNSLEPLVDETNDEE